MDHFLGTFPVSAQRGSTVLWKFLFDVMLKHIFVLPLIFLLLTSHLPHPPYSPWSLISFQVSQRKKEGGGGGREGRGWGWVGWVVGGGLLKVLICTGCLLNVNVASIVFRIKISSCHAFYTTCRYSSILGHYTLQVLQCVYNWKIINLFLIKYL